MISLEINQGQMKRLEAAVNAAGKSMGKELSAAINEAAKKARLDMGRNVRNAVTLKKQVVEKPIKLKVGATPSNLSAVVSLGHEDRKAFGLQHFSARQTGVGVSYRISKAAGRRTIAGAFMGPKPGVLAPKLYGGVFKRMGPRRKMTKGSRVGKMAEPIVKLYGVSPWGVYAVNQWAKTDVVFISKNLSNLIERRINLNVLRANGLVKK